MRDPFEPSSSVLHFSGSRLAIGALVFLCLLAVVSMTFSVHPPTCVPELYKEQPLLFAPNFSEV